jgi:hypothetical protein
MACSIVVNPILEIEPEIKQTLEYPATLLVFQKLIAKDAWNWLSLKTNQTVLDNKTILVKILRGIYGILYRIKILIGKGFLDPCITIIILANGMYSAVKRKNYRVIEIIVFHATPAFLLWTIHIKEEAYQEEIFSSIPQ